MPDVIRLSAGQGDVGKRIDQYISLNTQLSRNSVQILMENEKIIVNDKIVNKSYKIKNSDIVQIIIDPPKETGILAQDISLDIYYEDNDLLVVNKPKGMVVHPANGNSENTMVNALIYHCKDSLSGINGEIRPGIVHRIDKDTSGLLVVAKNDFSHEHLARQFKEHSITRIYNAIVYGNIKSEDGEINLPIGRDIKDRKKLCITEKNAKNAVTHYKVLEKLNGFTLIEAQLETGRTHQIRVHMKSMGHPLAGDLVYGPKSVIKELHGQALHAGVIGFIHPTKGQYLEFKSPWCDEFQKFYEKVKLR